MAGKPRRSLSFPQAPLAWSALVARNLAPALLALGLGLSEPALAASGPTPLPEFSAAQLELIARNETLRAVLSRQPWLVHRVLKEMEKARAAGDERAAPLAEPRRTRKERFDKMRDPDLNGMERVSPEAAYDLFQMLKKVRQERKAGATQK